MRTDEVKIILEYKDDSSRVHCEVKVTSTDPVVEELVAGDGYNKCNYAINGMIAAIATICNRTGMDGDVVLRMIKSGLVKAEDYLRLTGQLGRHYN